jgi:hypothetical protein
MHTLLNEIFYHQLFTCTKQTHYLWGLSCLDGQEETCILSLLVFKVFTFTSITS